MSCQYEEVYLISIFTIGYNAPMFKKRIYRGSRERELQSQSNSEVTIDQRFKTLLLHIASHRNVFYQFDDGRDENITKAIYFLEQKGISVWHREANTLTLDDVGPQIIEDGRQSFRDHPLWDGFSVVVLQRCEALYQEDDICAHLLATIAILNQNNEYPVVVMTHSGELPDYRYTCDSYKEFEQRLLEQIV